MIKCLKYVIAMTPTSKTIILLENPAGQGTELCVRLEDYAQVANAFSQKNINHVYNYVSILAISLLPDMI